MSDEPAPPLLSAACGSDPHLLESLKKSLRWVGVWAALYLASGWGCYRLVLPHAADKVALFASAMIAVGGASLIVAAAVGLALSPRVWLRASLVLLAVDWVLNGPVAKVLRPEANPWPKLGLVFFADLVIVVLSLCLGMLVACGLRRQAYIVLAAIVGAVADCYSVFGGPTSHIVKTSAVNFMILQWPLLGQGEIGGVIGMGDFLFLALFLAGARKFGFHPGRNLAAMVLAFAVGYTVVLTTGKGLPALPFMGVAFFAVNWKKLSLSREDAKTIAVVTLGLALGLACLLLLLPRGLKL